MFLFPDQVPVCLESDQTMEELDKDNFSLMRTPNVEELCLYSKCGEQEN